MKQNKATLLIAVCLAVAISVPAITKPAPKRKGKKVTSWGQLKDLHKTGKKEVRRVNCEWYKTDQTIPTLHTHQEAR